MPTLARQNIPTMASPQDPQPDAVVPLPHFPSIATLVNGRNDDLVEAILKITEQHRLCLHLQKLNGVIQHLWMVNGCGIFDGSSASWSAGQANRNMKSLMDMILNKYGCYRPGLVPYTSHLQVLTKRIFGNYQRDRANYSQRRSYRALAVGDTSRVKRLL
jgi:hypothetical protein